MNIAKEEHTRAVLLNIAASLGCKMELQQIFDKYDRILRNCTNQSELLHIKRLALNDVNNLLEVQYNLKKASEMGKDDKLIKLD